MEHDAIVNGFTHANAEQGANQSQALSKAKRTLSQQ
jgi:hypothetical protein